MSTANGAPLKLPKNERISTPFRFKGVYEAPIGTYLVTPDFDREHFFYYIRFYERMRVLF